MHHVQELVQFRKNPDIFIRNAPDNLDKFVSIQNKILDNSAKILRKMVLSCM